MKARHNLMSPCIQKAPFTTLFPQRHGRSHFTLGQHHAYSDRPTCCFQERLMEAVGLFQSPTPKQSSLNLFFTLFPCLQPYFQICLNQLCLVLSYDMIHPLRSYPFHMR
jgi:hypothetical protein